MTTTMKQTKSVFFWVALMACAMAALMLTPGAAQAQPAENVKQSMALLKAEAAKLGTPEVKGEEPVAGKSAPALYFGSTKMNNNFALVDAVQQKMGGTATFFVKDGDDFTRVATNVKKDDGSRATGTNLDPKGKAIAAIKKGEAYYGEADILGKAYVTGYEPIRSADGNVIGIYYVGYLKAQP